MNSDDGNVKFLHKVSVRAQPQNTEMKRIGSGTALFVAKESGQENVASLLGGKVAVLDPESSIETMHSEESTDSVNGSSSSKESPRAAVHMDAMAFGMGCCCLQITFQAKDIEESRFIFDQLNVMAPMYVQFYI
jgi:hypothetical protein